VRAGIGYVAHQPTTDARRIGLLGFSNGALIAIGTAGLDRRVCALVETLRGDAIGVERRHNPPPPYADPPW
jgi:dienelactone hydrolase